ETVVLPSFRNLSRLCGSVPSGTDAPRAASRTFGRPSRRSGTFQKGTGDTGATSQRGATSALATASAEPGAADPCSPTGAWPDMSEGRRTLTGTSITAPGGNVVLSESSTAALGTVTDEAKVGASSRSVLFLRVSVPVTTWPSCQYAATSSTASESAAS